MTSRATTLVDALADTVHRCRGAGAVRWLASGTWSGLTWDELGTGVRHAALALDAAGTGRGDRVLVDVADPRVRWQAELAVLATGAAVVLPVVGAGATAPGDTLGGTPAPDDAAPADAAVTVRITDGGDGAAATVTPSSGEATDWESLLAVGRAVDADEPDRYERIRAEVTGDDVALVAAGDDGGTRTYTHAAVDCALRSLQRAVPVGPDDGVVLTLDVRTATGWLLTTALAAHTGAEVVVGGEVDLGVLLATAEPAVVVAGPAAWSAVAVGLDLEPRWLTPLERSQAVTLRARRALGDAVRHRKLRPVGLASCRAAIVVGGPVDGTRPAEVADSLHARGVPAHGALTVDGVLGLVTMGRAGEPGAGAVAGGPLPGVTVAVDDDGTLAVRSGGAGRTAGDDTVPAWVATGIAASLDGGDNVVLGPAA